MWLMFWREEAWIKRQEKISWSVFTSEVWGWAMPCFFKGQKRTWSLQKCILSANLPGHTWLYLSNSNFSSLIFSAIVFGPNWALSWTHLPQFIVGSLKIIAQVLWVGTAFCHQSLNPTCQPSFVLVFWKPTVLQLCSGLKSSVQNWCPNLCLINQIKTCIYIYVRIIKKK